MRSKRAFTTVELIVVIAILATLALLAVPRFLGYTAEAQETRLAADAKLLENAVQTYYLKNGDWPRLSDTPYTADETAAFAAKVYDNTGKVIVLDPTGNYYDLDMQKLSPYIAMQEDPKNFVLQNPVGSIYFLEPKTNVRLPENAPDGASPSPAPTPAASKPVAVITMTPSQGITTTTTIAWNAAGSYDTNSGGTITQEEWTGKQDVYSTEGSYTVTLRVQNDAGIWSDPSSVTFSVINARSVKQIVAGSYFTLALLQDGTAKAWGANANGQLGIGSTSQQNSPVDIPGLAAVQQLAAGDGFAMALLQDGTVKTWGQNTNGQLGLGDTTTRTSPTLVPDLTGVRRIAAGAMYALALLSDGTVKAWGYNNHGQLGLGNTTNQTRPTAIPNITGAQQVEAGNEHTLALMQDGTIKAWGYNGYGQLGIGSTADRYSPTTVSGLTGIRYLTGGFNTTLALLSDGTVKAWGANAYGKLGLGDTTTRTSPVAVPGLTGVTEITSGYLNALALQQDGIMKAWGYNGNGQLGIGTTDTNAHTTPVIVPGMTDIRHIPTDLSGSLFSLALVQDGTVMAWGNNQSGQLGIGNTVQQNSPVAVVGLN